MNWKRKLASRKLWAAVIGVVTAAAALFGLDGMTTGQIVSLVSAVAVLVAYIAGESAADCANAKKPSSDPAAKVD